LKNAPACGNTHKAHVLKYLKGSSKHVPSVFALSMEVKISYIHRTKNTENCGLEGHCPEAYKHPEIRAPHSGGISQENEKHNEALCGK
jgi:hypothetical protein